MGGILLANIIFIVLAFKELKLATFDAGLAAALGFSPALIHYALMSLVSITAVGAFDAVGSILVVALMIAPPAAAYLLTDNLGRMLAISAVLGVASAIGGYWVAYVVDTSISGSMATVAGLLFLLSFLLAPERGLIAIAGRRRRQKWEFAQAMLAIHLFTHENLPEAREECRADHLTDHLNWTKPFAAEVVRRAERHEVISRRGELLTLTDQGRDLARETIVG